MATVKRSGQQRQFFLNEYINRTDGCIASILERYVASNPLRLFLPASPIFGCLDSVALLQPVVVWQDVCLEHVSCITESHYFAGIEGTDG